MQDPNWPGRAGRSASAHAEVFGRFVKTLAKLLARRQQGLRAPAAKFP